MCLGKLHKLCIYDFILLFYNTLIYWSHYDDDGDDNNYDNTDNYNDKDNDNDNDNNNDRW